MRINMRSLVVLTVALGIAQFFGVSQVDAQEGLTESKDLPPWVEIESLEWAGSGCPPDSESITLKGNLKNHPVLVFSDLLAEVGPGVPFRERRKNCTLVLRLRFPKKWSFTIYKVVYRGVASLEGRVEGTLRSAYFFEGQESSVASQTTLQGSFDDDYRIADTLDPANVVWSPCGLERALSINTEVRANNRKAPAKSGLISLDKILLGIKWQRCD